MVSVVDVVDDVDCAKPTPDISGRVTIAASRLFSTVYSPYYELAVLKRSGFGCHVVLLAGESGGDRGAGRHIRACGTSTQARELRRLLVKAQRADGPRRFRVF